MPKQAETIKKHEQFDIPKPSNVDMPFERVNDRWQVKDDIFSDFIKSKKGYRFGKNGEIEIGDIALPNVYLGSQTKTLSAGQNIQTAIDSLPSDGGIIYLEKGTHNINYEIVGKDRVSIIGAGKDLTILEFNGTANGITYTGTSSVPLTNFELKNFTLQNSNNAAGIDLDYYDFWKIENVRATSCDQAGIRWKHSQHFSVENTTSDNNTGKGFISLGGESTRPTNYFILSNLTADSNTDDGFDFDQDDASGIGAAYGTTINCLSIDNSKGFEIDSVSLKFINCISTSNNDDGFEMDNDYSTFISCESTGNGGYGFQMLNNTDTLSIINPFLGSNTSGDLDVPAGSFTQITDSVVSSGSSIQNNTYDRKIVKMKNTSGGGLTAGNVIVIKAVASGEEITTTTTQGDDFVWGVLMNSASSNGVAIVLKEGKTTLLTVDGTTDIAIGDYLGTFTSAGIAMKAAAGDMAFAIALEAYTTDDSSGVIDALLIKPRKI